MNVTNGEVVAKYFKLLTDQEIKKLYKIYENDFLLFNYQFEFRGMKFNVPPPSSPGTNNYSRISQDFILLICIFFILVYLNALRRF